MKPSSVTVLVIQSPIPLYELFVCIIRDLITSAGVHKQEDMNPEHILDITWSGVVSGICNVF